MAKSQTTMTRTISLKLELSNDEARVLMEMVQNPLWDQDPSQEDPIQSEVRSAIFYALYPHFHEKITTLTEENLSGCREDF